MDISFKGFKNAGTHRNIFYMNGIKKVSFTTINTELTNDARGKDLMEFQKIFQKSANKYNPNFLNFQVLQNFNQIDTHYPKYKYFVNGDVYEADENNLELFGKIARLLKKIINTDDKDFKVNKDYLDSDDMKNSLLLNSKIHELGDIEEMHSPKCVKKVAGDLLKNITESIEEVLS